MRRLHRLLHDCHQLLAQRVQVHLTAQGCTEGRQGAGRIILATIEATINETLDTMTQAADPYLRSLCSLVQRIGQVLKRLEGRDPSKERCSSARLLYYYIPVSKSLRQRYESDFLGKFDFLAWATKPFSF